MSLSRQFEQAANKVSSGALQSLSQGDQLALYALYSIARKGPAPKKGPSAFLNPRGHAKWTAWSAQNHLSKEEAMLEYIQLVTQLDSKPTSQRSNTNASSSASPFGDKALTGFDMGESAHADGSDARHDICLWATKGDVKSVKYCLEKENVSPDFCDEDGLTALMRAVDRNNREVVEVLVAAGADLNAVDGEGQTALHYAAYCDHKEMAGLLVMFGADLEVEDKDGFKPLQAATGETWEAMMAAKEGRWKCDEVNLEEKVGARGSGQTSEWLSKNWYLGVGLSFVVATGVIIWYRYRR